MSRQEPRAIVRDDRALILVPEALRAETRQSFGGEFAEVELHLSSEDYRALVRQMPGEVHDFMAWIISLDDPDPESQGFADRRSVTMTQIIRRAKEAMGGAETS